MERLRYWRGQSLASRDFVDRERGETFRQRWHDGSLHSIPGVAFGLKVTPGQQNPRILSVSCGAAYDSRARLLVLQREVEIAAPDNGVLVLRARASDAASGCCPASTPGCEPADAHALERDVELVWEADRDDLSGVVLARMADGKLDTSFHREAARPLAKPRLARGETVRGNTPWEPWEVDQPDGKGGFRRDTVGVQTRIDASAVGFTETPCYFASVNAPRWDLDQAEFAPAYFPSIADASVTGFTFRLLMRPIARRRHEPAAGFVRVTSRDARTIRVDKAGVFEKFDMAALVRPRGEQARFVTEGPGGQLSIGAPMPAGVEDGKTMLAIGHAPRRAAFTVVAEALLVETSPSVNATDLLFRNATAFSFALDGGKLRLPPPAAPLAIGEALERVTRNDTSLLDANQAPSHTGGITTAKLRRAVVAPTAQAMLLPGRDRVAVVSILTVAADGVTITFSSVAGTPAFDRVAALETVAVKAVDPVAESKVTVAGDNPFRKGDFVLVEGTTARTILSVTDVSGDEVELNVRPAQGKGTLVAASWIGATRVSAVTSLSRFTAGRVGAAYADCIAARRLAAGWDTPVFVNAAVDRDITLQAAITGLSQGDTIAFGVFPKIFTASNVNGAQFTASGSIPRIGDTVMVLAAGSSAELARVDNVSGNTVTLRRAIAGLADGVQLATVEFDDVTLLKASSPASIDIDPPLSTRPGDFVAPLTEFVDISSPVFAEDASNTVLTAYQTAPYDGDGIVPQGWIDGGILAFASFEGGRYASSRFVPPLSAPPSTAALAGFDQNSGAVMSQDHFLAPLPPKHTVLFSPGTYRIRPETAALLVAFNTDFPRAFAAFAQRMMLSVSWTGCQHDFTPPPHCPGVREEPLECAACAGGQE